MILVRHAHRNKPQGASHDNGLSPKGQKQAIAIQNRFIEQFGKNGKGLLLVSSPKARCVETIEPIAKLTKVSIFELQELDEGGNLNKKIKDFFLEWVANPPPLTIACSHGDWIPTALHMICGAQTDLEKGGWVELDFSVGDQKFQLKWILQEV